MAEVPILRTTVSFGSWGSTLPASPFPRLPHWLLLIHMKTKQISFSGLEACGEDSRVRIIFYVFSSRADDSYCFLENRASGQKITVKDYRNGPFAFTFFTNRSTLIVLFHFLNPFSDLLQPLTILLLTSPGITFFCLPFPRHYLDKSRYIFPGKRIKWTPSLALWGLEIQGEHWQELSMPTCRRHLIF